MPKKNKFLEITRMLQKPLRIKTKIVCLKKREERAARMCVSSIFYFFQVLQKSFSMHREFLDFYRRMGSSLVGRNQKCQSASIIIF